MTQRDDKKLKELLDAYLGGNHVAGEELFQHLAKALKHKMHHLYLGMLENGTRQPTEIFHEALIKLLNKEGLTFESYGQFEAFVFKTARYCLIDYIRQRAAKKRGDGFQIEGFEEGELAGKAEDIDGLISYHQAMELLTRKNPKAAEILELKYTAGMSNAEIQQKLGLSEHHVKADLKRYKKWANKLLSHKLTSF